MHKRKMPGKYQRALRKRNIPKPEDVARIYCEENRDPSDGLIKVKINEKIGEFFFVFFVFLYTPMIFEILQAIRTLFR